MTISAAPMTVWGRADSSAVARVMWTIGELDLPSRRIDWGGPFGGNDDPVFRRRSPPGKIPAIETTDGFSLWESNAIIRWLAREHPQAGLWPDGARNQAQAEAWMDWSVAAGTAVGAVRTAYRRDAPQADEIAGTLAKAAQTLQVLSRNLRDHAYVMGPHLSVADLALGVIVHRWFRVPESLHPVRDPALQAWYARLCERPAYREHVLDKVSVRAQIIGR